MWYAEMISVLLLILVVVDATIRKEKLSRKLATSPSKNLFTSVNIQSLERNIKIRKSNLQRDFFKATVEPVLLYGSTTWPLTKYLEASLEIPRSIT